MMISEAGVVHVDSDESFSIVCRQNLFPSSHEFQVVQDCWFLIELATLTNS